MGHPVLLPVVTPPRFPDDGGVRTTNYNIAAVLAGLDDKAVTQK